MIYSEPATDWSQVGDHRVQFYDTEEALLSPLQRYVREGLEAGDGVVVLASDLHLSSLRIDLGRLLLPGQLEHAILKGQLLLASVEKVVESICGPEIIDYPSFRTQMLTLIARARLASSSRKVRVFGELVAYFSAVGRFDDALTIEAEWNQLREQQDFYLLCAYPFDHFPSAEHRSQFEAVCGCHTHIDSAAGAFGWLNDHKSATELAVCQQQARVAQYDVLDHLVQTRKLETLALCNENVARNIEHFHESLERAADFLLASDLRDEQQRRAALDIKMASARARGLSTRLLTLGSEQSFAPEILSPNELIKSIYPLLLRIVDTHAEFAIKLDPAAGHICADLQQVEQMVVNLLMNALDSAPENSRILLGTDRLEVAADDSSGCPLAVGPYVLLQVFDNHVGAKTTDHKHRFDPFASARETWTEVGLALVDELAQRNGGRVLIDQDPGVGTTISIALPAVDPDTAP